MAVTVAAKNYTSLSSCDTSTSGGTWLVLTTADAEAFKEGAASLCGTIKNSGNNDVTFTPTVAKDLSGTKHVRWWMILNQGSKLNTDAAGGVQFWASDGTNTGYWYVGGRTTYPGGWYNFVIDVSRACDAGTKPTNMNAITTMGFRINLTAAVKNAVNTWVDHLCICDGLVAYGDDGGGYFDMDDIFAADDASTLATGTIRRLAGVYLLAGSMEIGLASGTEACKFQTKSAVVVFEDRKVNVALYAITEVDNGTGTTEMIFGSKSGTGASAKGIEGCTIRVASLTQSATFTITATDADITDFALYGTTVLGAGTISLPATATNIEVLNCNFERCAEIQPSTCKIRNCNFISSQSTTTGAVKIDSTSFDIQSSNFIGCSRAIRFPSGSQNSYGFYDLVFSNNTIDIRNEVANGQTVAIAKNGTSNPDTHEEPNGGTTTITGSVTITVTCKNSAGNAIEGVRVRVEKQSDGTLVTDGMTNSSGVFSDSYTGSTPLAVKITARLKGYVNASAFSTIEALIGMSVPFTMIDDGVVNLP